jgi:hypothetical protein
MGEHKVTAKDPVVFYFPAFAEQLHSGIVSHGNDLTHQSEGKAA